MWARTRKNMQRTIPVLKLNHGLSRRPGRIAPARLPFGLQSEEMFSGRHGSQVDKPRVQWKGIEWRWRTDPSQETCGHLQSTIDKDVKSHRGTMIRRNGILHLEQFVRFDFEWKGWLTELSRAGTENICFCNDL